MSIEFSPVIYEHAAKLIKKSPWEVSRSSELLYKAHLEAHQTYNHSPIVVGIDIYNLEAEAYGAVVNQPEGNDVPSISTSVFTSPGEIQNIKFFDTENDGRIQLIIEAGKKLAKELPNCDIRVPIGGPFSIAGNLMGTENLVIESVMAPDSVKTALEHLVAGQVILCKKIISNNLNVTFFESSAAPPLISPQTFKDILLPSLKEMFQSIQQITDQKPAFIMGGNTEPIIESILETGTNYIICPAETDQIRFIEKMKSFPDVMVRINMNANVMISNEWNIVKNEVDRVLAIAKNREKVCIGTGVTPYETEPDLIHKIQDYINSVT